jgi:hypothetical protein
MIRQQTWRDFKLRSRRWFADVGIAQRFPRLSLDSRHLQTGHVSLNWWPISFASGQYGPCHPRQFVSQRDTNDVIVAAR